ncbi:MAG TPA: hypothetical protein VHK64_09270 [Nocardioidaceae bacterium]|nr:hypothetical protein [Nocardioidaceae bacterium]
MTSTHARTERRGEARLPAALAVLAAIALYALLPENLLLGPRLVIPALGVLLLVALVVVNPRRMTRQTRFSRIASLVLVGLIGFANTVALVMLLRALLASQVQDGRALLVAALQVWLTNIIVFGLAYWELDRGGPVARTQRPRAELLPADFRFSQDENDDAISEVAAGSSKKSGWVPALHDYLYVSLTNSTAFSPTDTMPLTGRAKLLMGVECSSALIVSVLVIARGVGILQ